MKKDKPKRPYWNYRVFAHKEKGSLWFGVHETHYTKKGKPVNYTNNSIAPFGYTPKDLKGDLKYMKKALKKPVLLYESKPIEEYKVSKNNQTDIIRNVNPLWNGGNFPKKYLKSTYEILNYKDYYGSLEFSKEDDCYYGQVLYINDLISYEADNVKNLKKEFKKSVKEYLKTCKEVGKTSPKINTRSKKKRVSEKAVLAVLNKTK